MEATELSIRSATEEDLPAIIALAAAALGWDVAAPNEALFRWKHLQNPFGRSPMWLAHSGGEAVGFRSFLRWEFVAPDGTIEPAVRAVDTATHPAHQGRGIFRCLTLHALDDLEAEGVGFVFNTPNEQSRPGYLKMGWSTVGRVPIAARPTSVRAVRRMVGARAPAGKWSVGSRAGEPASSVLADRAALGELLEGSSSDDRWSTRRTPDYLWWRYAAGPVQYRVVLAGSDVRDGIAIFRLRPRGAALEAVIADVLLPGEGRRDQERALLRAVVSAARPDYLIATVRGLSDGVARRLVPLPGQGPVLTWRGLRRRSAPQLHQWGFVLGDIELF